MMIQTSELKKLEEVYGQSGNQIVLLYGRDNCQKEQLIKEFCKEKKFFTIAPDRHPKGNRFCRWGRKWKQNTEFV